MPMSMRLFVAAAALSFAVACGHTLPEATDGGADGGADAGLSPVLGPLGGALEQLTFAVVGDTRPATQDDNAGYPTGVITQIYKDISALSPQPGFVVATGDYQYTTPGGGNAKIQIGNYATAMKLFPGPVFPAMGNHECTGYTKSECGSGDGNPDGMTTNLTEFIGQLLGPISQPKPYYAIPLHATDGSWTAKVVVVAANAWDDVQSAWLEQALSPSTTYTFVVRHEPSSVGGKCPGVPPSDAIIQAHPYTMLLVGHSHTYEHVNGSYQELIVGNGGAPIYTSRWDPTTIPFGFALITRGSDGNLKVTQYDSSSNSPTGSPFSITPSGQPASN